MKSYHCNMCNYKTHNKQNYNSHLLSKIHSMNCDNEHRLHTCSFCDKTFSHRSSLSRHMNHSCKKREREKEPNEDKIEIKNLQDIISDQYTEINKLKDRILELESVHEHYTPNHDNKNDINNSKPIEIIYDETLNEIVENQLIEDLCVL